MSQIKRREVAYAIMFFVGFLMVVEYFFPGIPGAHTLATDIQSWVEVIAAGALILGTLALLQMKFRSIVGRKKNWQLDLWLIAVFAITVMLYGLSSGDVTMEPYASWFSATFSPLDQAQYAILGFMVMYGAYRVFRIRTVESLIMVVVMVVILLTMVPVGEVVSPSIPAFGFWIMDVPGLGATRGYEITAALGAIVLSLRIIMGFEKRIFG